MYPRFERPLLSSMLCYRRLEIHNNVWRRALRFHCVPGPQNYVCLLAGYVLCFLVQTSFFLKAEKRHWHQGKRRRLSGEKREYGDSGIFGEVSTTQGLCGHLHWQVRNTLCCLSFKAALTLSQVNNYFIDHSVRPGFW